MKESNKFKPLNVARTFQTLQTAPLPCTGLSALVGLTLHIIAVLSTRLLNHPTCIPDGVQATIALLALLIAPCRHCAVNCSAVSQAGLRAIIA